MGFVGEKKINDMKIICNSSVLREKIKEAFDVDAHCIKYYATEGDLTFCTTKKYRSDVSMPVDRQYQGSSEVIHFNNMRMVRLYDLLKYFPEQPIVLQIDEEDIQITQSVIKIV